MTWKPVIKFKTLESFQTIWPFIYVPIAHVWQPGEHHVSSERDPLLRQENDYITAGMRTPKMQQLDFSVATID